MKKVWSKPELIVLYRAKPEELVLAACKYSSTGGLGTTYGPCYSFEFMPGSCKLVNCYDPAPS
jgi:hypothetical protein